MTVRSGTNLKADLAAIATAVDTQIATPNQTNANAVVTACDTLIANARDSMPTVTESATLGTGSRSLPAGRGLPKDFEELAGQVRREALSASRPGTLADASYWRKQVQRTLITNSLWLMLADRPTTT